MRAPLWILSWIQSHLRRRWGASQSEGLTETRQGSPFVALSRWRPVFQGFGEDADGYCDTITAVAEVIKLTDPSLLYLEVSTLVSKYPDIR